MSVSKSKQLFNWQGISENADGSYTAENTRAKKRLVKEFHRQGYSVRSTHGEGSQWTVRVIAPGRVMGRRPTVREGGISRYPYSRYPRYGYRPRPRGFYPPPRGHFAPPPRAGGSFGRGIDRLAHRIKERKREKMLKKEREGKEREEFRKSREEIEKKMEKERIESERKEVAYQIRKQEIHREQMAREQRAKEAHDRAETVRQLKKQEHDREEREKQAKVERGRTMARHAQFQAERVRERESRFTKETNINPSVIQKAREEQVSEE